MEGGKEVIFSFLRGSELSNWKKVLVFIGEPPCSQKIAFTESGLKKKSLETEVLLGVVRAPCSPHP